jgi:hypothetical protein
MIGIYTDDFIKFLKDNLGENNVKITSHNIIISCPWCEVNDLNKKHYHLYISLQLPIFHCFRASCPKKSGNISTLVKKITGNDISEQFINSDLVVQSKKLNKEKRILAPKEVYIPELNEDKFKLKSLYIRKRLGFMDVDLKSIKGLIFDIDNFIDINKNFIQDKNIFKLKEYLHTNFIGFLTENHSIVIFRNIDNSSTFKHFKIQLQKINFVDYYKIEGFNYNSNHIILAEGIFDILSESVFNILNIKNKIKLYACSLSCNYQSLIKSIVLNEKIYRPDISILSDIDVKLEYYKNLKKYNSHVINSLTVYYNKGGKDFNDFIVVPEKFII